MSVYYLRRPAGDTPWTLFYRARLGLPLIKRRILAGAWRWWPAQRVASDAGRLWRWEKRARRCIAPGAARGQTASLGPAASKRRLIMRGGQRPSKKRRRWVQHEGGAVLRWWPITPILRRCERSSRG